MRRTQRSTKKAKISSTTRVQLLQWLHGEQQQHHQPSSWCRRRCRAHPPGSGRTSWGAAAQAPEKIHLKKLHLRHPNGNTTVCPGSSDPFHIVTYYMKWVTTSWTHSMVYELYL